MQLVEALEEPGYLAAHARPVEIVEEHLDLNHRTLLRERRLPHADGQTQPRLQGFVEVPLNIRQRHAGAGLKTARSFGAELKLLKVSGRVYSTLDMARLLPTFEIFEDEAEAIRSFGAA